MGWLAGNSSISPARSTEPNAVGNNWNETIGAGNLVHTHARPVTSHCESVHHRMDKVSPAERESVFDLAPYPHLRQAWDRSRSSLKTIRSELEGANLSPSIDAVVVSGSLGRMEQVPQSDLDAIVILHDQVDPESTAGRQAFRAVWQVLEPLGHAAPKSDGIFSSPTTAARLCRPDDLGRIAEDPSVFGKRFQMLLDCQPVYRSGTFQSLRDQILQRYGSADATLRPSDQWEYLLNDQARYAHSLAVRNQWQLRDQPGRWRLQSLKLQHSRRVLFAGLYLLLGECSKERTDKYEWLRNRLSLTPLERVATVYSLNGDDGIERVAAHYDRFLGCMQDQSFRQRVLEDGQEAGPIDEQPDYRELFDNGRSMSRELIRFSLGRRTTWDDRFFELTLSH